MIASVFQRRRTERFAQLLDEASGARRHHVRSAIDENLADVVAVSQRLAELPVKVEAHPEFRDGLRAMLLATIDREGIGATAVAPRSELEPIGQRGVRFGRRGERLLGARTGAGDGPGAPSRTPLIRHTKARGAIVIGLAAGTLALSGMSAASGDAIPGDPLYSMKRSTERAQLALAGSDISRGQLFLEFARTRLDEAQAVHNDAAGLTSVLDDMDGETQQGVKLLTTTAIDRRDGVALDSVDTFANTQRGALARLRDGVTGEGHQRTNASLTLLDEILRRSKALRQVLRCGAAATTAPDALGPLPKGACRVTGERLNNPVGPQQTYGNSGVPNGPVGAPMTAAPNTPAAGPAESADSAPTLQADPSPAPASPNPGAPRDNGGLLGGLHGLLGG